MNSDDQLMRVLTYYVAISPILLAGKREERENPTACSILRVLLSLELPMKHYAKRGHRSLTVSEPLTVSNDQLKRLLDSCDAALSSLAALAMNSLYISFVIFGVLSDLTGKTHGPV